MAEISEVNIKRRLLIQLGVPFFLLIGFVVGAIIFGTLYFAGQLSNPGPSVDEEAIAAEMVAVVESFIDEARTAIEPALVGSEEALRDVLSDNRTVLAGAYLDEAGSVTTQLHKSRTPEAVLQYFLTPSQYQSSGSETVASYVSGANDLYIILLRQTDQGSVAALIDGQLIKDTARSYTVEKPMRIRLMRNNATDIFTVNSLSFSTESVDATQRRLEDVFADGKQDYGFVLESGTRIEGHWKPVSGAQWNVLAEVPGYNLPGGAGNIFLIAGIVIVMFVLLVFFYLYMVNRKLIVPLRRIEKSLHYYKTGDYSEPVKVDVANEFIAIADQLNSMARHIENNTSERVSQLKKVLERQNMDTKLLIDKDMELREQGQKLKELDQAKSMFVSVAAHQMRTPLAAVKWAIKLVMDGDVGPVNAEQKQYLMKGYESTTRMIDLINDLLDVDKIESDKFTYEFGTYQLEDIVQGIVDDLTPAAEEKGVHLVYNKADKEYPPIMADQVKLRNALQNLIDNAIKYTIGGGDVTVKLSRSETTFKLAVSDTGIGIPLSEQSKVFGKFFRAKNAVRRETDGSGLGLFIVKKLIERHGGTISFESKEGKGTTFHITLPTADDPNAPTPSTQEDGDESAKEEQPQTKEVPAEATKDNKDVNN